MLASGLSFRRLMRPYFISAALIAALNFYLGSYVIPQGTIIRQNFESQYKNDKKITSATNVQLQVGKGVIAYIQQYDDQTKNSVVCYQKRDFTIRTPQQKQASSALITTMMESASRAV